ncbi:MAG: transglycosylase SLT domain-containing protein [Aestuariivirga sp.]
MKKRLFAGVLAAAIYAIPAGAGCQSNDFCTPVTTKFAKKTIKTKSSLVSKSRTGTVRHLTQARFRQNFALAVTARHRSGVVSMIESMAPQYGVPTWFALRIAKVESGYNPNARGRAGELGVFQLKCSTARGIGYTGNCSGLLNARTGVQYGLKHLSLALKSSHGNLRLAASKHNGGLGRKSLVPAYIAQIF